MSTYVPNAKSISGILEPEAGRSHAVIMQTTPAHLHVGHFFSAEQMTTLVVRDTRHKELVTANTGGDGKDPREGLLLPLLLGYKVRAELSRGHKAVSAKGITLGWFWKSSFHFPSRGWILVFLWGTISSPIVRPRSLGRVTPPSPAHVKDLDNLFILSPWPQPLV